MILAWLWVDISPEVRYSGATEIAGDFTRSIGTTYYVAPEIKSTSTAQYNEKVDVSARPCVFIFDLANFNRCILWHHLSFEIIIHYARAWNWEPYFTRNARENHVLPPIFQQAEKAIQGEIIESLLIDHCPSERLLLLPSFFKAAKYPCKSKRRHFGELL